MKTKKFYEKPELEAIEFTAGRDICGASTEIIIDDPDDIVKILKQNNTQGGQAVSGLTLGQCKNFNVNISNGGGLDWASMTNPLYNRPFEAGDPVYICYTKEVEKDEEGNVIAGEYTIKALQKTAGGKK